VHSEKKAKLQIPMTKIQISQERIKLSPSPHWGEGKGEGAKRFGHLQLDFSCDLEFVFLNAMRSALCSMQTC
jgi:hypothetical protein